jgi:hypothetical protein
VNKHFKIFINIGVVFGIIMGIMFMSWDSEKRLNSMGFNTTNMNPIQQREIYVDQLLPQAIEKSRDALLTIPKLSILSVDTADKFISARVGMTWFSWGESVTVSFMPHGSGTLVCIFSKPLLRFTIVDYGKGVENVEIFVRGLFRANPSNHILEFDQS